MRRHGRVAFGLALCVALSCLREVGAEDMTVKELIADLKKAGAGEVALLEEFPADLVQSTPDFLGGATYVVATVRHPNHPHILRYVVRRGQAVYRLRLGEEEIERLRADLKLRVESADSALRFAAWRLVQTEGFGFWLVSELKDVPFLPERADDPERTARLARARAELPAKLTPPTVREEKGVFVVTQLAVKGRDLVRYEARVGRDGAWSCSREGVASGLPVVEVIAR